MKDQEPFEYTPMTDEPRERIDAEWGIFGLFCGFVILLGSAAVVIAAIWHGLKAWGVL